MVENGGQIVEILDGYVAETTDTVFKEFIEFFDDIKNTGFLEKKLAKFFINSFYGRLGVSKDIKKQMLTTTDPKNVDE